MSAIRRLAPVRLIATGHHRGRPGAAQVLARGRQLWRIRIAKFAGRAILYTINHHGSIPWRRQPSPCASNQRSRNDWKDWPRARAGAAPFSRPRRSASISTSTSGRWPASSRPSRGSTTAGRSAPAGQASGCIMGQQERAADPEALMIPVWSPEAIDDLAALRDYIEQDDPAAAQRVALHIIHNVETLLPQSPEMGRPGRVPGTRELVILGDAVYRAVPTARQHDPNLACVPRCASLAGALLRREHPWSGGFGPRLGPTYSHEIYTLTVRGRIANSNLTSPRGASPKRLLKAERGVVFRAATRNRGPGRHGNRPPDTRTRLRGASLYALRGTMPGRERGPGGPKSPRWSAERRASPIARGRGAPRKRPGVPTHGTPGVRRKHPAPSPACSRSPRRSGEKRPRESGGMRCAAPAREWSAGGEALAV